ncbi:alpha/beta fold hydrolase [Corynebacterium sp.]|uniref:alpha/beta fold hydrolase n=1 Tax=Corynebacterium sp. TaxID=1720 RepID=UPI0026DD6E01|nr:alpha/beta hydrolase [Corynebacterium sp.]MDO5031862.1 alpha/beta hydrolase [Corynebacterium sp.]
MAHSPLSPSVVELDGPFSHELLHTRGLRLHAATAGDPADPLVLLLHGSFGGWFDFRAVIAPLAEAGFHVAAIDMRGFGMSDKPPVELGQDIRAAVGDVSGVIQALGHDDAFLVGADSGGAVAWALATQRPERVRGLVSVSSAHPTDLRRAMAARPWDFSWLLLRALLCHTGNAVSRHNPLLRESSYQREMALNTLSSFDSSAREEALALRITASRIGSVSRGIVWNHRLRTAVVPLAWIDSKVSCPVLFIHAQQHLWQPLARRATRRCTGRFTATSIPGTKNLPFLENPREFSASLISWLRDK